MCTKFFRRPTKRSNLDDCSVLIKKFIIFFFKVIDAIARAIAGVEGVALLDIDPGVSTNRSVYSKKDDKYSSLNRF